MERSSLIRSGTLLMMRNPQSYQLAPLLDLDLARGRMSRVQEYRNVTWSVSNVLNVKSTVSSVHEAVSQMPGGESPLMLDKPAASPDPSKHVTADAGNHLALSGDFVQNLLRSCEVALVRKNKLRTGKVCWRFSSCCMTAHLSTRLLKKVVSPD